MGNSTVEQRHHAPGMLKQEVQIVAAIHNFPQIFFKLWFHDTSCNLCGDEKIVDTRCFDESWF